MDNAALEDLFAPIGRIEIRKMFGARGIYYQGMIIACAFEDRELMLKSDPEADPLFIAAGGKPWLYSHKSGGKQVRMPYCTLPEAALDDEDEFRKWCRIAIESARRAEIKKAEKPAKKPKSKPAS